MNRIDKVVEKAGILNEMSGASLSRIWQYLQNHDIGFISAYRPEFDKKKNMERSSQLKSSIRNLGMGYVQLEGRWVDSRTQKTSSEESLLISYCTTPVSIDPGDFEKCIIALGRIYDQDAVIVKKDGQSGIIYHRDGRKEPLGAWHPNKISTLYSKIKGRPFSFEKQTDSFDNIPLGMLGGMGWRHRREVELAELGIQFEGDII